MYNIIKYRGSYILEYNRGFGKVKYIDNTGHGWNNMNLIPSHCYHKTVEDVEEFIPEVVKSYGGNG